MILARNILPFLFCMFGCGTESTESKNSTESTCDDSLILYQLETQLPNVIRLYFTAQDCDGIGITDKTVADFNVIEGTDDITIEESSRQLLDNFVAFDIRTMLLIDMSGSLQDSGYLPTVQSAARSFVNDLVWSQPVAIYAFDGRAQIQLISDYTVDALALHDAIEGLSDFAVADPSTNLNGAINQSLNQFTQQQQASGEGIFHGALVVFTDGKDQAARITDDEIETRLSETNHHVYTIGMGTDIDAEQLADLGPQGTWTAAEPNELQSIFSSLADLLENKADSKYVLAYCSPKRNGIHTLQVTVQDGVGTFSAEFDAAGFTGACTEEDLIP